MRKLLLILLALFLAAPGAEAQTADQIGEIARRIEVMLLMMVPLAAVLALAAWLTRRGRG